MIIEFNGWELDYKLPFPQYDSGNCVKITFLRTHFFAFKCSMLKRCMMKYFQMKQHTYIKHMTFVC
jgi:hypothetical protein